MPEIGNSNEKQKTVLTRLVVARKLLINLLSNISSSFGRRNVVFQHDDKMNCNIFFCTIKNEPIIWSRTRKASQTTETYVSSLF